MIVLAAIFILYAAIEKWMTGLQLEGPREWDVRLGAAAGCLLATPDWGGNLIRTGRRSHSLTSGGQRQARSHRQLDQLRRGGRAGAGVLSTSWKPFDPPVAIAVAINILWAGGHLVWRSAVGPARPLGPGDWKRDPRQAGRPLRRAWACNITGYATAQRGIGSSSKSTRCSRTPWPSARPIGWRRCWKNACRRNSACRPKSSPIWSRRKTTRPCIPQNTTQESRSKCRYNGRGNGRHDFRLNLSLTLLLAYSITAPVHGRDKSPDGHGTILTARFVALRGDRLRVRLIPRSSLALSNIGPVPPPGCSRA